ncbi:MAG: helix-turn-helix transcriptional regulator [Hydrogenoanaerobacterium sp.]
MNTLYEIIAELCNDAGITGGKLCGDIDIRRSLLTDLKNGRKQTLSIETLVKIATYFNVTVDRLLGNEQNEAPTQKDERGMTDSDLKFALWGDSDITDDDLADVRRYAAFIKERRKGEGK